MQGIRHGQGPRLISDASKMLRFTYDVVLVKSPEDFRVISDPIVALDVTEDLIPPGQLPTLRNDREYP